MCAAFSAMGSSVLMPFRPERDYEVEFAMFGGGTQGKGREPPASARPPAVFKQHAWPCNNSCVRVFPAFAAAGPITLGGRSSRLEGLPPSPAACPFALSPVDCKGICNEPASKYIFRMKLPTVKQALAGEWPKYWAFTGAKQYEEMPWP
jgi:hypothetical protein